ncbi:MAG: hypothetical protein GY832_20865 [Chloroflexi bacterium]|nr:hypothetical protein [Chloroflexota bacterium]
MLELLMALLTIFAQILLGMIVPFVLAMLGAAAVAGLLLLAGFRWKPRGIRTLLSFWFGVNMFPLPLMGGIGCAFIYSVMGVLNDGFKGSLLLFLISLVTGLNFLFIRYMAPNNKSFRWYVFYAVWVHYWLAASVGLRYGFWGVILITVPAIIITGLVFFYIAGHLLPYPDLKVKGGTRGMVETLDHDLKRFFVMLRDPENIKVREKWFKQRREGLRCLLSYAIGTNYPYYVVIDEKITERTEDSRTWLPWKEKLVKRLDGDTFGDFLAGPGVILTGCDQAVVISTGLKFKGAKGPGVILTEMSETPSHVIDLRVQLRAFPVKARTKDGIAVRVFTFTPFRMGTGQQKPELGKGFPYRTSDVFKAIHAQMVEHHDPSQVPEDLKQYEWYDLPQVIGERTVREAVSQYNFDDLYAPFVLHDDPSQHPRARIGKALQEALERELPPLGLQRVGSGISNLEPEDPRVIEQRIEAWEADWKRKIMLQQAEGQSKRLQLVERARAQAQIDVIVDIGKRLDQWRTAGGSVPTDAIAQYFIGTLEKFIGISALRHFLPDDTNAIIENARGRLLSGDQPSMTGGQSNAS